MLIAHSVLAPTTGRQLQPVDRLAQFQLDSGCCRWRPYATAGQSTSDHRWGATPIKGPFVLPAELSGPAARCRLDCSSFFLQSQSQPQTQTHPFRTRVRARLPTFMKELNQSACLGASRRRQTDTDCISGCAAGNSAATAGIPTLLRMQRRRRRAAQPSERLNCRRTTEVGCSFSEGERQ